jgi:hypothetical protein
MGGSPRAIELIAQAFDFFAQRVSLIAIPIPIAVRARVLAPQPLDLTLLSLQRVHQTFELRDQLLAGGGAPSRLHTSLMPRSGWEYKRKLRRARRSESGSERITR